MAMRKCQGGGALLLCGWIIMAPPVVDGPKGPTVKEMAPIREWTHQSVYDTAYDCEKTVTNMVNDAGDKLRAGAKYPGFEGMSESEYKGWLMATNKVRCIPAEAVYPPAKSR